MSILIVGPGPDADPGTLRIRGCCLWRHHAEPGEFQLRLGNFS